MTSKVSLNHSNELMFAHLLFYFAIFLGNMLKKEQNALVVFDSCTPFRFLVQSYLE